MGNTKETIYKYSTLLIWVSIGLSSSAHMLIGNWHEASVLLLISILFIIPTLMFVKRVWMEAIKYFQVVAVLAIILGMAYIRQGAFDNYFFFFLLFTYSSVFNDIKFALWIYGLIMVSSLVLYVFFNDYFFGDFN